VLLLSLSLGDDQSRWVREQCCLQATAVVDVVVDVGLVVVEKVIGPRDGRKRLPSLEAIGVLHGVAKLAMDSLKFHPGPPPLTFLHSADGSPLKRPYSCFRVGPPAGRAACGVRRAACGVRPSSTLWTPHAYEFGSSLPKSRRNVAILI
jgi:hypothetical protein